MPTYVYQTEEDGCDFCGDGFERLQEINEDPVEQCPKCGADVTRVPAAFHAGKGDILSNRNLQEHGFHKLRKTSDGGYEQEV
ncbi:MAG: FmdB family zinc ribbon protein [Candidatus Brocadiia bacterium]